MKLNTPIISSLLDTDLYKFSMGAVVFHNFPDAIARYQFTNRGKTPFPPGFKAVLEAQIYEMKYLQLGDLEFEWFKDLPFVRPTYAEWLRGYRYNPDEVSISQNGGDLSIEIEGPWYRTILWEVPIMALVSELFFKMIGVEATGDEWVNRIISKGKDLSEAGCLWSDFGTRRRFSTQVHQNVVRFMASNKGFLGTSNCQLAVLNNVNPIGTSAHEAVMAMSAFSSPTVANELWLSYWYDYYKRKLAIALTDTFTTEVFLKTFTPLDAGLWEGLRQDSGNPHDWVTKVVQHYRSMGIDTAKKKFVFSDNLNVPKAIELHNSYKNICIPIFGIGTNFTNDVFTNAQVAQGLKPLNMVIKLKEIDFGEGWKPVVKLSDDKGKYTGDPEEIERVMGILGIK